MKNLIVGIYEEQSIDGNIVIHVLYGSDCRELAEQLLEIVDDWGDRVYESFHDETRNRLDTLNSMKRISGDDLLNFGITDAGYTLYARKIYADREAIRRMISEYLDFLQDQEGTGIIVSRMKEAYADVLDEGKLINALEGLKNYFYASGY